MNYRTITRRMFLPLLFAALLLPSCARYAPTPVAPKRSLMDITLQTLAPVSNNYYYYIAFDTSGSATTTGPIEELSGVNRLNNWTYYIVYDHGRFSELTISQPTDRDNIPTLFNASSPRFHTATVTGDTIHVILYLDKLISSPRKIWLNFVTSPYPVYANRDDILPIDYLTPPYFYVQSNQYNNPVSSTERPQISAHTPTGENQEVADIFYWNVEISER